MITPAYSTTATERVLPRMALDFTTGALDSRVTVTRALNTATAINSSGFIAVVNANLPRFDYDPVTLAPKGLLIEEARTNLVLRSQEFETANWTKGGAAVTANSTTSPDGTANADTLTEDTSTGDHRTFQTITVPNATACAFSVYVKPNGRSLINLTLAGIGEATYNISTGVVTNTAVGTAEIQAAGNGWYRCIIKFTTATTSYNAQIRLVSTGTTTSYTGNGISGVFLYGAQLEAGAFATSYIPTTTTSLTRNADVVSMTGTNFSSWFNQTEGTVFIAYTFGAGVTGAQAIYSISNGTEANRLIGFRADTISQNYDETGGGNLAFSGAANLGTYTSAIAYRTNNMAGAINGGTVLTDTTLTVVSGKTQINIGDRATGARSLNGHVKRISYWPQRLTNSELQAFSK